MPVGESMTKAQHRPVPYPPTRPSSKKPKIVDLTVEEDVVREIAPPLKPKSMSVKNMAAHQCVICLEGPTDAMATTCGHLFCSYCIQSALKMSKSCPVCRRPVTQKNLIHLELQGG